jgi:hypothetical protein
LTSRKIDKKKRKKTKIQNHPCIMLETDTEAEAVTAAVVIVIG